MLNSIYTEINIFVCCFFLGIVYGIIFDFFKVLRHGKAVKQITVIFQDVVYFIIITAISFKTLLFVNGIQLRIFMPLAAAFGFVIYRLLISNKVIWILIRIKTLILFVLKVIFKILVLPVVKTAKFILLPFFALKQKILRKKAKFSLTFRQFCFKIKCRVLKLFGGIKICKERKPCQRK